MSQALPPFDGFSSVGLEFLTELEANNNKDWFQANRDVWEAELLAPAKSFVVDLGARLKALRPELRAEPRVNGSIFRINRDTRFSKDKTPYKAHLDLWFWEGQDRSWSCSGFYFRLKPDSLHLGAGMHKFSKEILAAYRKAVVDDARGAALEAVIKRVTASGDYPVEGAHYKRVPRGFEADHPRAALLKYAGLHSGRSMPIPPAVHGPELVDHCLAEFQKLMPLHEWMAQIVDGVER